MKIATWNIERLKQQKRLREITTACEQVQADILVLTEADERVCLNYSYCYQTPTPPDMELPPYKEPLHYQPTEHRVSIYTNYKCIRQHATFDQYTALCVELETEKGNLLLYGTIIGILGNRRPSYMEDLIKQTEDFKRLSSGQKNLCICGDLNCSFSDSYCFTKNGRDHLLRSFEENHLALLTANQPSCIDHIAVSKHFILGSSIQTEEWNLEKRLSDHKGIAVHFS